MYKISWHEPDDKFATRFALCPCAVSAYELYYWLTRIKKLKDIVKVFDLDGHEVDMSKSFKDMCAHGTICRNTTSYYGG
jgi:hypothetical protein